MIRIKAKRNCRVAVLTDGVPTTLGARVRYDKVIEQTKSANISVKANKKWLNIATFWYWRRRRDSNSRADYSTNAFRVRPGTTTSVHLQNTHSLTRKLLFVKFILSKILTIIWVVIHLPILPNLSDKFKYFEW